MKTITSEQVLFYRKNGYLIVEDVIPYPLLDEALETFRRHARAEGDTEDKSIMNMDRHPGGESIRAIQVHPNMAAILENLYNRFNGIVAVQSMFLFKSAGTPYGNQAWNPHQDDSYVGMPWGTYFTGNIAFANQDVENGCMYIYPKSHFENILEFEPTPSFHENQAKNPGNRILKVPEKYRKIDLFLKKGSCLILHGNVIHGSYPNISKSRGRPMLLLPYIIDGVPFPRGNNANRMRIPLR